MKNILPLLCFLLLACTDKANRQRPLQQQVYLICPAAYTLHDELINYVNKESAEAIRNRSAEAYAKYQKCSVKAAKGLLVTGM